MKKIVILGANGRIAKLVEDFLQNDANFEVTLYLRDKQRLADRSDKFNLVEGDVTDEHKLVEVFSGADLVYANLAGKNIVEQAKSVVRAMNQAQVKRLIWISSIGIYDEVPGKFGEWNNATLGDYLTTYRAAVDVIEASDLDYTIIRPAWLTNNDEVDYEITQKDEPFKGTEVSRKSIAAVVYDLMKDPSKEIRHSIGVNKPNTDGDKPAFM